MDVSRYDLNLLLVFHVLYQECNASRAAERLSISQPGLTHKINKMRNEWKDPLFIKAPRGLTPTPKAHQIARQVGTLMGAVEHFFLSLDEQDFLHREERLHIYTTDYMEQTLFPRLLTRLSEQAPNVTLVAHNTNGRLPRAELESGQCDLAIAGFYSDLPDSFRQQKLCEERFVVLAARQNRFIGEPLDLEAYLACEHIVTTLTGDLQGLVDEVLQRQKLSRRVSAGVSGFLSPAAIVRNSNRIVTCLESLAKTAADLDDGLVIHELPIAVPTAKVMQIWHERTHSDQLRNWLRQQIHDLLQ
ncbi:MAG: LysR family transcriptional regulator [Pseudomonadota bacterium]|nr:LysR family transcriptional regulator [Pseudomonadota bacterium]